jgi:hypothetical protein
VKGSNTFGQRYATQAATNRAAADTASITVERYFTVTAEGNGESFNIQSNTPSAGNKIVRKIWYKDEAFEATDVDTWTLLHTFADDTTYANTATKWQEYLDGQANGTPPFTLAISWEEAPLFSGLLDTYSGAGVACSLRLLDKDYAGSAVRVRRASDNTEQDIGFDGNGDLDTSALTTFCTGTNGFIRTWYDQSGNANNLTQTTTSIQPKIYDSSTGVLLENGKPTIEFSSDNLVFSYTSSASDYTFFFVRDRTTTGGSYLFDSQTGRFVVEGNTDGLFFDGAWESGHITTLGQLQTSFFLSATAAVYANGALSKSTTYSQRAIGGTTTLGSSYLAANSSPFAGNIQEVIIYPSNQISNRAGIETNINDYYSIY